LIGVLGQRVWAMRGQVQERFIDSRKVRRESTDGHLGAPKSSKPVASIRKGGEVG